MSTHACLHGKWLSSPVIRFEFSVFTTVLCQKSASNVHSAGKLDSESNVSGYQARPGYKIQKLATGMFISVSGIRDVEILWLKVLPKVSGLENLRQACGSGSVIFDSGLCPARSFRHR